MSWLFSQALVAEFLQAPYSDGEPYVQWNLTPTAQAYLHNGKMTDFSRPSQFGMTFEPLMENLGTDLLTWFLADFPVKTSVSQMSPLLESPDRAVGCGNNLLGSLARYDHISYSWKTPQSSLLADLEEFLATWPKWGIMQDGECFRLAPLVHHIHVRGCSFWPTPVVSDIKGAVKHAYRLPNGRAIIDRKSGRYGAKLTDILGGTPNPTWTEWLMGWPQDWTALKPLAMDKSQYVQQWPFKLCHLD